MIFFFSCGAGVLYGLLIAALLERRDGRMRITRRPAGRVEAVLVALALLTGLVVLAFATLW